MGIFIAGGVSKTIVICMYIITWVLQLIVGIELFGTCVGW